MPFSKRTVEPQLLCRQLAGDEVLQFEDLRSISTRVLARTLRQLSDLARHACSLFQELEGEMVSTHQRLRLLQGKMGRLQRTASGLDPKQEAVPLSNLDVESKLTAHYQSPWPLQRNLFLPSTQPPCVDELHRNAKLSLRALHRDQQQCPRATTLERRVTISISVAPPMPTFPSPRAPRRQEQRSRHLRMDRMIKEPDIQPAQGKEKPARDSEFPQTQRKSERPRSISPIECCHFPPWIRKTVPPAEHDADAATLGHRPRCPVPNLPSTLDKHTNWSKALPLPTPEDRIKASHVISSSIIPINVTGAGFDREASVRCSLVHSQSVLQRRRKLRRRKTISGIPRRVQQEDSDESPVARERATAVHAIPDISSCHEELSLRGRLNTRDSGCQTDDFLIAAPSRRRIRAQRGQGIPTTLSHSTGNINSLPDSSDAMFAAASSSRLRSRSLPREGGRLVDDDDDDLDDSDDEELSPFEAEEFLPGPGERIIKDEEESTDDQAMPEHQLTSLKCKPEHSWIERGRSRFPRKVDMISCEISSSSDTFSSPIHSISTKGVLSNTIDHKEDHQSSSGNWSGSSSTCPSQTSETIPPAASPPLTGSSHCDSELSLNTATQSNDEPAGFGIDPYQLDRSQVRGHRASSFTSTVTDSMDDPSVSTASDGEWNYPQHQHDKICHQDFSPPRIRDTAGLECPSFTSVATYESFTDKTTSEKADSSSHYSVDTDGYFTSMNFDCGLKSGSSYFYNYAPPDPNCGQNVDVSHSVEEYYETDYRGQTLGRHCLSLKKPKVKPMPPKRSTSLRKINGDPSAPDKVEPKITSGQHMPLSSRDLNLQLEFACSLGESKHPSLGEGLAEDWDLESSEEIVESTLFGSTDTHSFKDEGAVQSDYADLWLLNDLKSSDPYRSLSLSSSATNATIVEFYKPPERSEPHISRSGFRPTSPTPPSAENEFKLASPEKLAGLASPSSGYSSQSETPTSSFPSAFFPGPLSPTSGKRKPKVPERKSSLSSLQHQLSSRDGSASSRRDLELPIMPPTHLDLSALHRNQMHILHQNKQRVAAAAAAAAEARAAGGRITELRTGEANSEMSVVPSVLPYASHSIDGNHNQLQSDGTARPKCPTWANHMRLMESKKLAAPKSKDPSSQEYCETLFTPEDKASTRDVGFHESIRYRHDRPGPMWAMTAFRIPSEHMYEPDEHLLGTLLQREELTFGNDLQEGIFCEGMVESATCFPESEDLHGNLEKCYSQQSGFEHVLEVPSLHLTRPGSPPAYDTIARKWDLGPSNCLDKVPIIIYQSEPSQANTINDTSGREEEFETSGDPTKSASPDSKEEGSTPDTEDYFSKESTPSDSSLSPMNEKAVDDDFISPNKARTTEDLFAMIHRSKRKVLGRKDSGELNVRNRGSAVPGSASAMTAGTPVAPCTPPAPQRMPGPIYRSAKKSNTSNEEFKLLLLKKGSRTDSSYRMSATEILKSPIAPKSLADVVAEMEPSSPQQPSPSGAEQLPFPKANTEGFSLKTIPMTASSRQGRSRVPPVANSSRYGIRSRFYTAPMQAISEGETENSDGSPHDDRSSQSSS